MYVMRPLSSQIPCIIYIMTAICNGIKIITFLYECYLWEKNQVQENTHKRFLKWIYGLFVRIISRINHPCIIYVWKNNLRLACKDLWKVNAHDEYCCVSICIELVLDFLAYIVQKVFCFVLISLQVLRITGSKIPYTALFWHSHAVMSGFCNLNLAIKEINFR